MFSLRFVGKGTSIPVLMRCINYEVGSMFVGTRIDKFVMDKYPCVECVLAEISY